jgi:hypothetical protein
MAKRKSNAQAFDLSYTRFAMEGKSGAKNDL